MENGHSTLSFYKNQRALLRKKAWKGKHWVFNKKYPHLHSILEDISFYPQTRSAGTSLLPIYSSPSLYLCLGLPWSRCRTLYLALRFAQAHLSSQPVTLDGVPSLHFIPSLKDDEGWSGSRIHDLVIFIWQQNAYLLLPPHEEGQTGATTLHHIAQCCEPPGFPHPNQSIHMGRAGCLSHKGPTRLFQ